MRTTNLEDCGVEFTSNFDLDGKINMEVTGYTKAGKSYKLKLEGCEWALRNLAVQIRDKFLTLKRHRQEDDIDNLNVFKP